MNLSASALRAKRSIGIAQIGFYAEVFAVAFQMQVRRMQSVASGQAAHAIQPGHGAHRAKNLRREK